MGSDRVLAPAERERWTRIGKLSALAMVLGYLETFVPIPIPGVKLGLANIAVLIALDSGDRGAAFYVGAIKAVATGLLFGNPITLAYSALGTLLAFVAMAPLSRVRGIHVALVSACGAIAHVVGQLVVAMALLGTPLVWYSAPLLLLASVATGLLSGAVASRALTLAEQGAAGDEPAPGCEPGAAGDGAPAAQLTPARSNARSLNPKATLVALSAFMVVMLVSSNGAVLGAGLAAACAACAFGRVGARTVLAALRPTAFILAVTFVAQVASVQQGEVLAAFGPVVVTSEALRQTLLMVVRLLALMAASIAVMHLVEFDGLMDAIRWFARPLERFGLRTEGLSLAVEVALGSVPAIVAAARAQSWSWRDLKATAPRFVAQVIAS